MKSSLILLLAAAPVASGWAQPTPIPKPTRVRPTPKPMADAPEMTMNRARAGTGQLRLGSGEFTISAVTLVLMPRNKLVEVALDTPRGKLLLLGQATMASGTLVAFTLDRGTGSLAEALKMPKRLAGTVTGRAQLALGRRTFNAITMSGRLQSRALSATFRSAALPTRKK